MGAFIGFNDHERANSLMSFVLLGLNHRTAPVSVREQLAFPDDVLVAAHRTLHKQFGLLEGMIVSTCNRVEVIGHCPGQGNATERIKSFLYGYHALQPPLLENYFYSYVEQAVIQHVFRVTSSLDSMVVGESQILGQMKRAYSAARQAGTVGTSLNRLMHRAFFVAKRVRTETQISASAVSVSSVAVELARKIFGNLDGKSILLLGAGKMSELAAQNLLHSGISRTFVANRTLEKAEELALKLGGVPLPFAELNHYLARSDIVLVSTTSESFVLDRSRLQGVVRQRKYAPLFVIDISVPRNVDPQINEMENVFLYDIDDLRSVISTNLGERQREAEIAEEIVAEEVLNYLKRASSVEVGPLIRALRQRIEEICLLELEKSRDTLTSAEYTQLEKVMRRTARKIAHPFIMQIKYPGENPNLQFYSIETIKKIFQLDDEQ